LTPAHEAYLRKIAKELPAGLAAAGPCKVVVLGKADAKKYPNDPFGNWDLSARRALAVLRFLYSCTDCGYGPEMQKRLVLLGEGDVESSGASGDDRRVDLVIDCTREIAP
jgi:flagellar motor protein MotB